MTPIHRCSLLLLLALGLVLGCERPPPPEPETRVVVLLSAPDAVRRGRLDHLKHHLALGLDVNQSDEMGLSLLHHAALSGQTEIAKWLIEQGAEVSRHDESGATPIVRALQEDYGAIVGLLQEYGAVLPEEEEDSEPVEYVQEPEPEPEPEEEERDVAQRADPDPGMPDEWRDLEVSIWRSATGVELPAVFLGLESDRVTLGGTDGRTFRIAMHNLHRDDQIRARRLGQAPLALRSPRASRPVASGPTRVSAGFSSECERMLIRGIQQARQEVLVAIYTLTHPQIKRALSEAAGRGVTVRVKYDEKQLPVSRMEELIKGMGRRGVELLPVQMSGQFSSMHHKFAVIDRATVFTGSFNFTVMAANHNYENCVVIESPEIAMQFVREFERIRGR